MQGCAGVPVCACSDWEVTSSVFTVDIFYFNFMCVSVLPAYESVYNYTPDTPGDEKRAYLAHGTGIIDS